MVSAIIADTLKNRLQEYITYYKTKKAKADVAYYNRLYKEAKLSYEATQRNMQLIVMLIKMYNYNPSFLSATN